MQVVCHYQQISSNWGWANSHKDNRCKTHTYTHAQRKFEIDVDRDLSRISGRAGTNWNDIRMKALVKSHFACKQCSDVRIVGRLATEGWTVWWCSGCWRCRYRWTCEWTDDLWMAVDQWMVPTHGIAPTDRCNLLSSLGQCSSVLWDAACTHRLFQLASALFSTHNSYPPTATACRLRSLNAHSCFSCWWQMDSCF